MPDLTSAQAKQLARHFLSLGRCITDYRIDNRKELTSEEQEKLSDLEWKITNYADDFISLSTTLILEDAENDLEKLQAITEDIEKSIHKVEMVQKVINVAGAVVSVGFAIVAKNPKGIGKELVGLSKVWNEDLPSEKKRKEADKSRES